MPQSKDGAYFMNPAMAKARDQQGPVAQGDGDPGLDDQGAGKVSADDAAYVDVADNCANCAHFVADGQACEVVADPVSSQGWCKLHTAGEGNEEGKLDAGAPDDGGSLLGSPGSGDAR